MTKSRSGRRPKQIDDRIAIDPTDKPVRPKRLKPHAARLWRSTIETSDVLRRSDTELAVQCCKIFQRLKEAEAAVDENPNDRQIVLTYRGYHADYLKTVTLLSLDPLGRLRSSAKTRRKKPADNADEIRFFGGPKTG